MLTSKITYLGHMRTKAIHIRSGQELITDAPVDNQGKGEAFSPTDLTATSLATCALTTMALKANVSDITIQEMEADVQKIMTTGPRRIAEIQIQVRLSISPDTENNRNIMEDSGRNCPVAFSLHPDLKQTLAFIYH